jgi:hypothetical protein
MAERRKAQAARQDDLLVYAVGRPMMFLAWALVFWGTAVALAALYVVVARGPAAAMDLLLPRTPLDLVNAALAAVAVIVWIAAIILLNRRPAREGPSPAADQAPSPPR